MKYSLAYIVLTSILIQIYSAFEFIAPTVTCTSCRINIADSYQFVLYRDTDPSLLPTPWNTQLVPAGASISIVFPVQYALVGNQVCSLLTINSNIVPQFGCAVNAGSNNITITGAVTSAIAISFVQIKISNVINPSPALITSSFMTKIGNDVSATDNTLGLVTLLPGQFQSLSITFNPTTVNTTSSMLVTAVLGNAVPASATIVVLFPDTTWAREITSTHTIPIQPTMACSSITNMSFLLTCSGTVSDTIYITLSNAFSTALPAGSTIKFSINNLFSPPTTQQADLITIMTKDDGYQVDSSSAYIQGLTPKPLTLSISSPTAFTINTNVVIGFDFTLSDTISRANYLVITFPAGSIVNYQNHACPQLSLTNVTYNSSTNRLTMYQATNSPIRNSGTLINLRIQSYTTPSSVRTTPPFTLTIMSGTGMKMTGSATINILPKAYTATVSTTNTRINAATSYTITFTLADQLLPSGYLVINLPSQLGMSGSIGVQISGSAINTNPTILFTNSTSIQLLNLNVTSTTVAVQNISIIITGLIQPSSVKNISSFTVAIYYSSANDIVAMATTTNVIQTTPGVITNATVKASSLVAARNSVTYTFSIQIADPLNSGSRVIVTVPTNDVGVSSGGVCMQGASTISCTVSGSDVSFTLNSAFAAGSLVNVSYSLFRNPPSTKPTSTFIISTFNSALEAVDILSNSTVVSLTMTTPSALTSPTLTRGSRQNSLPTSYIIMFTQVQALNITSATVTFTIPSSIFFNSPIICSYGSTAVPCIVSSNSIIIVFTPVYQDNFSYNFTIQNLYNPTSYRPTASITVTTSTSDRLYLYSTINTGLQVVNTIPSSFIALAFSFSNQFLNDNTNLVINVTNTDLIGYFIVQFAGSFAVNINTQITCFADTFIALCQLQFNNITNLFEVKVSAIGTIPLTSSITFTGLTNPATIPSDFTWISSYTSDNYLISENRSFIQFTTYCTFPCRQCLPAARNVCTSCYTTNLTNRIYLFQQQCLATCPSGYIVDNINFVCQACVLPCFQCLGAVDYCTSCVPNSTFQYLNRTNTTSTCLTDCPIFMYPDLTQIPSICVNCVAPCSMCTNVSACTTCISNFFLYGTQCLASCPPSVTVTINSTCVNCSSGCATCSISIDNCTSCPGTQSLFNGVCYTICPGNLISINNICVACDSTCRTCSITTSNCTSCNLTSLSPFFYNNMCLGACPDFYYNNSFGNCLSCNNLSIGCRNCSSPTICLSCDPGFVLLNSNCLSAVPDGYLNISGVAVPCQGDCATCFGILTNCTSCRTLNLLGNTCTSNCPPGTIALSRKCQPCTYPCGFCVNTTTTCTSCASNSSLFLSNNACISGSACPTFTYADNSTQSCVACISPCSQCNSSTICTTCINGYFYVNSTSTCEQSCAPGSVGINRVCQACLSPCVTCSVSTTRCLTCIPTFYHNPVTYQCTSSCPTGQIANQTSMQCMNCASPCKTCVNTTDTCLSCVTGTYLSNSLCVSVCPAGQYGSNGLCQTCENNCTTCTSAIACLSCTTPLVLYNQQCLQTCPDAFAIVSTDSVCTSCTTVVPQCSNCTPSGQCYSCYFPSIYFNSTCWQSCPTNYTYTDFTCVYQTPADIILSQTLSSYSFPIPFTILGCVIFVACSMSKLQNSNTYLIGLLYTMFGLVENGSLAYLLYSYLTLQVAAFVQNNLYILYSVAAGIYILNIFALIIQTPILVTDTKFSTWLKNSNKSFFTFTTLTSFVINYKFKMILFTRLFKFNSTNAYLQNVYKFRLFNVFSFFGILIQALGLYVSIISILKFKFANSIFQAFLDVIIIFFINILLAILIVWKPDDFFHQQTQQGYAINKKFSVNGDDFSKQAIIDDQIQDNIINHGPDTYNLLSSAAIPELEEKSQQSLSQKLTQHEKTIHNTISISRGKNLKVYFANCQIQNYTADNGDSSNPFRNRKDQIQKLQQIHVENSSRVNNQQKVHNIFSDVSGADERFSHDQVQNQLQHDASQRGGSQNLQARQSPHSPRKHSTLVYVAPQKLKTNLATQNDDDINNKISSRAKQLQQLKKQLDDQQQARKQKRKSKKKLKKSIDVDYFDQKPKQQPAQQSNIKQNKQQQQNQPIKSQPSEASYQQISIKDSSQRQQTQYDSNPKTAEQQRKGNSSNNRIQLDQQVKLANVEQDFQEKPRDTIGSWMQMKITEENRKLPVFTARTNQQLKTISQPESQQHNYNDFEEQNHPSQHLQQESKQLEIDSQIRQIRQKNQEKQKLRNQQKLRLKQQLRKNMQKQQQEQQQIIFEKKQNNQQQPQQIQQSQQNENSQKALIQIQAPILKNNQIKQNQINYQDQNTKRKKIQQNSPKKDQQKLEFQEDELMQNSKRINSYQDQRDQQINQEVDQNKLQTKKYDESVIYVERQSKYLEDSSKLTIQIRKETRKDENKKQNNQPYQFEQQSNDYDQRAGTRLNMKNFERQSLQNASLQDSHHQDQKINERPYSARRKNNLPKSQALLQILARAQHQKMHSKNHQIKKFQPRDSYQRKDFKYSGGPIHSQAVQQHETDQKDEEVFKRSRMYMAGLNQFQKQGQQRLNRKKTMNHPLNSMKKKSIQDSEISSSLNKSRNKSFNNAPIRKFTSKDMTTDQMDELGLEYQDYKKNYEELMNERGTTQQKPGTAISSRSNATQKNRSTFNNIRKSNIKDRSEDIEQQNESLENYYRKQKMKSNQKRNKSKHLSREKSFQQTRRVKQLQKIYLAKH